MSTHASRTPSSQSGFALILAMLALILLTVLGLTLATTTTTEMQIAANYRYGRQALYNADAGMQAARYVLARLALAGTAAANLPPLRQPPTYPSVNWLEDGAVTPPPVTLPNLTAGELGDYYPQLPLPAAGVGCDTRAGVGYGRILIDTGGTPMRERSIWEGQGLQGGFTIWVRRALEARPDGTFQDSADDTLVTVTVMGTAPYRGAIAANVQNQAVRVIEQTIRLTSAGTVGNPCGSGIYQTGKDQLGTGFDACGELTGAEFMPGWIQP